MCAAVMESDRLRENKILPNFSGDTCITREDVLVSPGIAHQQGGPCVPLGVSGKGKTPAKFGLMRWEQLCASVRGRRWADLVDDEPVEQILFVDVAGRSRSLYCSLHMSGAELADMIASATAFVSASAKRSHQVYASSH